MLAAVRQRFSLRRAAESGLRARTRHSRTLLAGIVAVGYLIAAAPSTAATTIGQNGNAGSTCIAGLTVNQGVSAAGSPGYTVPAGGGVITSWSYLAPASADQIKFLVIRPSGAGFTVMQETGVQTMTASALNTIPVRFPVAGGDGIAIHVVSNNAGCAETVAVQPADRLDGCNACDPAVGGAYSPAPIGNYRVNVAASVEADADQDGFGDETQDACPAKATTQAACVTTGPTITGKTEVGKTLSAAATAQGGTLTYQWLRGSGNTYKPIAGATKATYKLAKADRGKRIEVTVTASASQSATSSPTGVVGPPSIKSSVKKTQRAVKQRGVVVRVKSNLAGTLTVTGTVALPKGVAKTLRFKRVKRSLKANKTRKLKVTFSKKSFASLTRGLSGDQRLKAKLVLTVKDKLGGKTSKKVTVKLKR